MKYVTFGEIMLRLTVPDNTRILNTDLFTVSYAGAEANVAVALALYGCDASFVTKLPEGQLGQAARNQVRRYGVDTSDIVAAGVSESISTKRASATGRQALYTTGKTPRSPRLTRRNSTGTGYLTAQAGITAPASLRRSRKMPRK